MRMYVCLAASHRAMALIGLCATYLAAMALACLVVGFGCVRLATLALDGLWQPVPAVAMVPVGAAARAAESPATHTLGSWQPTQEDKFLERLHNPDFWAKQGGGAKSSQAAAKPVSYRTEERSNQTRRDSRQAKWSAGDDSYDGKYRTLCVRLCDGYYWPISFATSSEHFKRDAHLCERSCSQSAKLFIVKSPNGVAEDMEDLAGKPYARLKTAFLYRTSYNGECRCAANPWEPAATDRHRLYALEAARVKGDGKVSLELADLRKRVVVAQNTTRPGKSAEWSRDDDKSTWSKKSKTAVASKSRSDDSGDDDATPTVAARTSKTVQTAKSPAVVATPPRGLTKSASHKPASYSPPSTGGAGNGKKAEATWHKAVFAGN